MAYDVGVVTTQIPRPTQPGVGALRLEEAKRAIFIDYEASVNRPPTLLGVRIEKDTKVWVLEELVHCCVGRNRTPRTVAGAHARVAMEIVDRAEHEDRVIVSWSAHDFRILLGQLVGDARRQDILRDRYRDAKQPGRRWMQRQSARWRQAAKEQGHTLELYRNRLRIYQPERFGTGVAGNAIRLLREQLTEGRVYATLTPKAKASWRALVRHNEFDLTSLQAISVRVTADVAAKKQKQVSHVAAGS